MIYCLEKCRSIGAEGPTVQTQTVKQVTANQADIVVMDKLQQYR